MAEKNSTSAEGDKIDPGAEGDEGSKAPLPDFDETGPPDYNVEMKRLLCKRLEADIRHSELLCDRLEIDNGESPKERKQRVLLWLLVTWVAGVVPVIALLGLPIVMIASPDNFFDKMNSAVLIIASFSSMVVIYVFLIKGMFPGVQKNDTNDTHPVTDETMKAVRSVLAGKE